MNSAEYNLLKAIGEYAKIATTAELKIMVEKFLAATK